MKLSEAIRKGAKIHPQAFGTFQSTDIEGCVSTCAFGAALVGWTGRLPDDIEATSGMDPEDYLMQKMGIAELTLERVTSWNDDAMLTREEIADILEREGS